MNYGHVALGAGFLLTVGTVSALALGCGGGGANSNRETSSSNDLFTGTLTVENGTGQTVCGVELVGNDMFVAHTDEIAPGATISLEVPSPAHTIFATACDGSGFAHFADINLRESTYQMGSGDEQTYQERYDYLLEQLRMSTTLPPQDTSLIAQFQTATEIKARDAGWLDDPTVLGVASSWDTLRNRRTSIITGRRIAALVGHRFHDGHCSIQIHTYAQGHDGSDFSGTIGYEGNAGNVYTGCSMLDSMMSGGGGTLTSASAPSGGGGSGAGCTNSCSSSGDGECDDGGPDSLYAVCGLGTDCDDCGAR